MDVLAKPIEAIIKPIKTIISRDSNEDSDSPESDRILQTVVRDEIPEEDKFRFIHIVAFILSAVLGREYSGWTPALVNGFGMFAVAQLLAAGACLGYYLCMAEIWSAIPFSGGCYGLSRASLGFYLGFLDGCTEALVYVAHSAVSAMSLGTKLVKLFELPSHYQLLFCFVFYVISVWITIQKSLRPLKWSFMILAAVSFIILFMYIFGVWKYVNFVENAPLKNSENIAAIDNWFVGDMTDFMFMLPFSVLPYAGVKSFALLTINTKDPKRTLSMGVLAGFWIIFIMNMIVIFTFVSMPPGILKTAAMPQPMGYGNLLMFKLDPLNNFRLTTWLSIPAAYAKLLTYILPGGNLFHCLGNSYYLPPFLCINKTKDRTNGCIVCGCLGFALVLIIHFYPTIDLYNVTIMATMITCCTFIFSYIQLRTTYSNVERSYVSPAGIFGGLFCLFFYSLIGVSTAFFQKTWFNLKFAAGFFVILTVYYFLIAKKGENLCEEEDKIFLQLHVRNYNMSKKKNMKHKKAKSKKAGMIAPSDGESSDGGNNSNSVTLVTKPVSKDVTNREANSSRKSNRIIPSGIEGNTLPENEVLFERTNTRDSMDQKTLAKFIVSDTLFLDEVPHVPYKAEHEDTYSLASQVMLKGARDVYGQEEVVEEEVSEEKNNLS